MDTLSYITEATHNFDKCVVHMKKHKSIDLACICCKKIFLVTDIKEIYCIPFEGTIQCDECFMDVTIPIVEGSVLFGKNEDEIRTQLNIWSDEMFAVRDQILLEQK